ncbi:MAG: hypothetical protein JSU95_15220 [Betaproteobacteria bacterium]|nr:MAG: hypothetical protein JSU95_15220 [Betaproteobacteria bacterium]
MMHGVMLQRMYEATAELWRPIDEMNMGLMNLVTLVGATCFAAVYALFIRPKTTTTGLIYGLVFGIGVGFSMGFGTYSVMPVPVMLGLAWFVGLVVESVIGGLPLAAIIREPIAGAP